MGLQGSGLLVLALACAPAVAQPAKPIRIVVPIGAGGPADNIARIVAPLLSEALARPVIVENKPGADGAIGGELVSRAAPDGETLLLGGNSSMVIVPLLHKNAPYDSVSGFTPISFVARVALCLFTHPGIPAHSMPELIAHARANPGKLNYYTVAATDAIAAAQFAKIAGVQMTRVPYRAASQAIPDLMAGRVHMGLSACALGLQHAKQGKLRVLASVLPRRTASTTDIPTMSEVGLPEMSISGWMGLFGPPGMQAEVVERLSRELNAILRRPDIEAQFDRNVVQVQGSTPGELARHLRRDLEATRQIVAETGMTVD